MMSLKKDNVSAKEFYGGVLKLVNEYVRGTNAEQRSSISSVKDALIGRYRFYADYDKKLSLQEAMTEITDIAENARYSLPASKGAVTCCLMGRYSAAHVEKAAGGGYRPQCMAQRQCQGNVYT